VLRGAIKYFKWPAQQKSLGIPDVKHRNLKGFIYKTEVCNFKENKLRTYETLGTNKERFFISLLLFLVLTTRPQNPTTRLWIQLKTEATLSSHGEQDQCHPLRQGRSCTAARLWLDPIIMRPQWRHSRSTTMSFPDQWRQFPSRDNHRQPFRWEHKIHIFDFSMTFIKKF
jgi:hypothetical protein